MEVIRRAATASYPRITTIHLVWAGHVSGSLYEQGQITEHSKKAAPFTAKLRPERSRRY
ncbi:hypothetical protein L218DRAFT_967022, partial [Marasmius fiardii PR-910]